MGEGGGAATGKIETVALPTLTLPHKGGGDNKGGGNNKLWAGAAGAMVIALLSAPAMAGRAPVDPRQDSSLDQAREYADCMTLARRVPDQALESAQVWQGKGGGIPAGHCAAVALIGLGHYADAASALEKLAVEQVKTNKALAAGIYGQAAQSWILSNDSKRAILDQNAALTLTPEDPDLLIDRGVTLASVAKYWDALDDFNKAHELAPSRADILVFRATAYRQLASLDLARDDINEALRLQPKNPDAYLERGIIRQLGKDMAGAKEDWQKAVAYGPGTPAADTAEANLEQLDQQGAAPAPQGQPGAAPAPQAQPPAPQAQPTMPALPPSPVQ
jgi:tetratricopeptide (TPR) repeat protein